MSRVLLDTHVFMWWIQEPSRIRPEWLESVLDPDNSVHVSAACAWEIETKKRIGKLSFDHAVADVASEFGFEHLSVTIDHAALAGSLDWNHRDPFDRIIVAQALSNEMILITSDAAVKSAPGVRVL
ncbi:MAG: type II toxin-antitoxin system VapC family toxin [Galbitalea sp.]